MWIRAGSGHTGRKPSILVSLKQRYKFMWHNGKCSWKYSFGPEHLVGKKRHQLPEKGEEGRIPKKLFGDTGFKGLMGLLSDFSHLLEPTNSQRGLSQQSRGEIWAGYLGVIRTR